MKIEIKNFLKSNLLGLISLILILSSSVDAYVWTSNTITKVQFQKLREWAVNGGVTNGEESCLKTWYPNSWTKYKRRIDPAPVDRNLTNCGSLGGEKSTSDLSPTVNGWASFTYTCIPGCK